MMDRNIWVIILLKFSSTSLCNLRLSDKSCKFCNFKYQLEPLLGPFLVCGLALLTYWENLISIPFLTCKSCAAANIKSGNYSIIFEMAFQNPDINPLKVYNGIKLEQTCDPEDRVSPPRKC